MFLIGGGFRPIKSYSQGVIRRSIGGGGVSLYCHILDVISDFWDSTEIALFVIFFAAAAVFFNCFIYDYALDCLIVKYNMEYFFVFYLFIHFHVLDLCATYGSKEQ